MNLTDLTDSVPLRKGVGFGIEWKASGLPDHPQLVFSYRISHPRIVRPMAAYLRSPLTKFLCR
jgi:hypothetical protein